MARYRIFSRYREHSTRIRAPRSYVGRLSHLLMGPAWLLIWSIIVGFSIDPLMLDFCRALQGLGAAAFLPTGVMLMGSLYRPGPRKNLVFAIYGTSAVFGFFGGIFVAGIVGQFLRTPNAPLISPHGSTSHSSRNLVATHSCLAPSVVYAPAMKAGHVVAVNRALLGRMNER